MPISQYPVFSCGTDLCLPRYDLVFGKEQIDPAQEICDVAEIVTSIYLTEEEALPFTDPNSGIIRKLVRAKNLLSRDSRNKELLNGFKDAVDVYNKALEVPLKNGSLAKNLDSMHYLPYDMVRLILRQVYDRVVSPQVDTLKNKKENKENTYGELLPPFVSKIFEETHLKSDQVFVDLGSGVGNVVLQAALEIGCEGWGCEMMPNACDLADAQEKEFAARCRLWGIRTGDVRLVRGDFMQTTAIHEAMRRADVILVNNEVFGSMLNRDLIHLFLDVKDGCKVVHLQPFVGSDDKMKSRTLNDPVNLFDRIEKQYFENWVSWKFESGNYYISTKNDRRLKEFEHLG
jgi:H3 lysine-79-specific histone-lysine N-methyltransferase